MKQEQLIVAGAMTLLAAGVAAAGVRVGPPVEINEIRIDQPGADSDEYVEIIGAPGTSLDRPFDPDVGVDTPGEPNPVCEVKREPCKGDLDGDGFVGPADLAMLLGAWGPNPGDPADFDDNGIVGPADLASLLGAWGECPE